MERHPHTITVDEMPPHTQRASDGAATGPTGTEGTPRAQRPTIGRIVLFTQSEGVPPVNGQTEHVAIIGQVFDDGNGLPPYCNLLVMPPFDRPYWEGSVLEGTGSRTWRWPPRA